MTFRLMLLAAAAVGGCARMHLDAAWELYEGGDVATAAAELYRAEHRIESDKPDVEMLAEVAYLRALCLEKEKRSAEAAAVFQFVARKYPDSPHAHAARQKLSKKPGPGGS